eukprot:c10329_g1_i1.p1 GENE.c10329_g1_i1~~c10329_g1_i1.p1  ORF type:complete len:192 (-),score=62.82 c10329_g1_i1:41-616(-)
MSFALVLGFVVMWLLLQWVTKFDLDDLPRGSKAAAISIGPFNIIGLIMWMFLFISSRSFRSQYFELLSVSTSWAITGFWLVCFFLCCILAKYFSDKATVWPNIENLTEHQKNRVHIHNLNDITKAHNMSLVSAALSFFVFVLWVFVARYRTENWRLVQSLTSETIQVETEETEGTTTQEIQNNEMHPLNVV